MWQIREFQTPAQDGLNTIGWMGLTRTHENERNKRVDQVWLRKFLLFGKKFSISQAATHPMADGPYNETDLKFSSQYPTSGNEPFRNHNHVLLSFSILILLPYMMKSMENSVNGWQEAITTWRLVCAFFFFPVNVLPWKKISKETFCILESWAISRSREPLKKAFAP